MDRLNANAGPVFLTYKAEPEIDAIVKKRCAAPPTYDFVADDGIGPTEDLDWRNSDTLGLRLVADLCHQIRSTASLDCSDGTRWRIVFSEKEL